MPKKQIYTKEEVTLRRRKRSRDRYWEIIKPNPIILKKSRKQITKLVREWRIKNPEKVSAHRKVFVAIRNGSLKKNECFCGEKKVDAHHKDYSKPLDVVWLCRSHHGEADIKRRNS